MCSTTVRAPLNRSSWCTNPLNRCINGPIGRLFTRMSPFTIVPAGLRWANADISVLLPAPLKDTKAVILYWIHLERMNHIYIPGAHNGQQYTRLNTPRCIIDNPFRFFFATQQFTGFDSGKHWHISPDQFGAVIVVRWCLNRIVFRQFKMIVFHFHTEPSDKSEFWLISLFCALVAHTHTITATQYQYNCFPSTSVNLYTLHWNVLLPINDEPWYRWFSIRLLCKCESIHKTALPFS